MAKGKLTPKQQAFCDYYIELGNGTQAAIKAGYSRSSASAIATENLGKPAIAQYIAAQMEAMHSERIASAEEVLEYLTGVMRRDEKEVVVVTLLEENVDFRPDETGVMRRYVSKKSVAAPVEVQNRVVDANKAAELLGKRYRLFEGQVNQEAMERVDSLFKEFKDAVVAETIVDDDVDAPVAEVAVPDEGEAAEGMLN